ncbi:precorrin-6A synthase (deacetylating) [Actinosynnema sp. NPDC047251]|uniref:Precorrin-6A synthase [deacetylating] n=1 Tax=Saccharothrix espanaensis (strain ATCC 51144 / DSM 44229 / JCM 9112 / NBRC 15066 / NRRL 15764) TaxID=1179773 RepID=K0K2M0_SACES|nr:precorrin-6A synthase (deacetylating) [Saccharothrix espanaensis]CCH30813.1 Precorrin-6A synthase [deacetylating] [Saccharothrix espanaensis DSM 44229]
MRTIHLIGIGAGDPEHITVQAVNRLNEVDVFFLLDKGDAKKDLVDARLAILERYVAQPRYRVVRAVDADRDRTPANYRETVAEWHGRRADLYEGLFRDELRDGQVGAVLCWGDPTLYDNTIAVIEDVRRRGHVEFDYTVVPGVSSVSALVAAHRISLNQIGAPVLVTTGRRLAADGFPDDVDDVVVMLDAHCAFTGLDDPDLDLYWGAYLGTPDELIAAGPLTEVAKTIPPLREQARERKGWIMDTYLLRRRKR